MSDLPLSNLFVMMNDDACIYKCQTWIYKYFLFGPISVLKQGSCGRIQDRIKGQGVLLLRISKKGQIMMSDHMIRLCRRRGCIIHLCGRIEPYISLYSHIVCIIVYRIIVFCPLFHFVPNLHPNLIWFKKNKKTIISLRLLFSLSLSSHVETQISQNLTTYDILYVPVQSTSSLFDLLCFPLTSSCCCSGSPELPWHPPE